MIMVAVPGTPADEHLYVGVVTTIADTSAPSLATDLSSVIDLTCYFTPDGWTPATDEQAATDPRLCSKQIFEQPGRVTVTLDTIYIDNTNSQNENLALETLVPGTPMFFVVRRGLPYTQALAQGDKVNIYPITPGEYKPLPPEANSVLKMGQKQFITGPVQQSVEVAT